MEEVLHVITVGSTLITVLHVGKFSEKRKGTAPTKADPFLF